jgi:hypothetical protein
MSLKANSFIFSDRDNPFRPDSELAKEAAEDAKKYKYLSALSSNKTAIPIETVNDTTKPEQLNSFVPVKVLINDASVNNNDSDNSKNNNNYDHHTNINVSANADKSLKQIEGSNGNDKTNNDGKKKEKEKSKKNKMKKEEKAKSKSKKGQSKSGCSIS